MDIFKIIGIALIGVAASVLLKQYRKEISLTITICTGAVIIFWVCDSLTPVLNAVNTMMRGVEGGNNFLQILTKSLGICFLTQVSSDICRDSGETAIAGKVETAGKIAVLLIAIPLFISLLDLAGTLIWM